MNVMIIAMMVDVRRTKLDGEFVVTCLIGITDVPRRDSAIVVVVVVVVVVNSKLRKIIFQQNVVAVVTPLVFSISLNKSMEHFFPRSVFVLNSSRYFLGCK